MTQKRAVLIAAAIEFVALATFVALALAKSR
jgi:hypothetical protein